MLSMPGACGRRWWSIAIAFMVGFACLMSTGAAAVTERIFLTAGELRVLGVMLTADPPTQVVPAGVATLVRVPLVAAGDPSQVVPIGDLPTTMRVRGELRGPGLVSPLELECAPGESLGIPGFAAEGDYRVENLRLVDGGTVVMVAEPSSVAITVQNLLVSSVTSRPLSLQEIRDRGLILDESAYELIEYTVSMAFAGGRIDLALPSLIPPSGPPLPLPEVLKPFDIGPAASAPMARSTGVIDGSFTLVPLELDGEPGSGVSLSGAMIFPQAVGFLRQFHSVVLIVTNAAPTTSPLAVKELMASFHLPNGKLERVTTTPLTVGDVPVPIRVPGRDGKLGTADDLVVIAAGVSGSSELVTKGMAEGSHRVDVDVAGIVSGLPIGDQPIHGRAAGVVLVKNPNFDLAFLVPSVVEAGREFEVSAVLTNTSDTVANLCSIRLPRSSAVGATLLSEELVLLDTLSPGESKAARFRFRALRTGALAATRFANPGQNLSGRFEIQLAVNQDGYPLSPDVLALPDVAYRLPQRLVDELLGLVGSLWSNATAPAGGLPAGVPQITRREVSRAALRIADAGQRLGLGESALSVLSQLWLRFGGGEDGTATFDQLRRRARRWPAVNAAFRDAIKAELDASSLSAGDGAVAIATTHFYLAPFTLVALDQHGDDVATLGIKDGATRRVGFDQRDLDLPTADVLRLDSRRTLAAIANPDRGMYTVELEAKRDGQVDLTLVVPFEDGGVTRLRQVVLANLDLKAGVTARVRFDRDTTEYELEIEGKLEKQSFGTELAIPGLAILSATVARDMDPGNHVLAILFNRPVEPGSALHGANFRFTGPAMPGQKLLTGSLQASGRNLFLRLQNPIPPDPVSWVSVSGLIDAELNPMSPPATGAVAIAVPASGEWGRVEGVVFDGGGRTLPNLRVSLSETMPTTFGGGYAKVVTALATTDAGGAYKLWFARKTDVALEVAAVAGNGEQARAISTLRGDGDTLRLDLRLIGRGVVTGRVVDDHARVVAGALVTGTSTRASDGGEDFAQAWSDSAGRFRLENLPVGSVNLTAKSHAGQYAAASVMVPLAGAEVSAGDLVLRTIGLGHVRGRVLGAGVGVAASPVVVRSSGTSPPWGTWKLSDADGGYAFLEVPAGELTLTALDPLTYGECARTTHTLAAGHTLDLDLHCALAAAGKGRVEGILRDSGGHPMDGTVTLAGHPPIDVSRISGATFGFTDVGLGSGTVTGRPLGTSEPIGTASYTLRYDGETTGVIVRLPATGRLLTTVKYRGAAVADATVELAYSTFVCTTTAAGFCDLTVPIGTYDLDAYWHQPPNPACAGVGRATVRFHGDEVNADVHLPESYHLTGQVLEGAAPAGGATITLRAMGIDSEHHLRLVEYIVPPASVPAGSFDAGSVFAGPYEVSARSTTIPPATGRISGNLTGDREVEVNLARAPEVDLTLHFRSPDGSELPAGTIAGELRFVGAPLGLAIDANDKLFPIPAGPFEFNATFTTTTGKLWATRSMGSAADDLTLDVRLLGLGTVSGVVRTAVGDPVPNAAVTLSAFGIPGPAEVHQLDSDAAGKVTFLDVREGPFGIHAEKASMEGVANGAVAHGGSTDVDVRFSPVATIAGTVFEPDGIHPATAVSVVLKRWYEAREFPHTKSWAAVDGDATDAEGAFTVGPVEYAESFGTTYLVSVLDLTTGRAASKFVVVTGSISGLELRLGARGSVAGFVLDSNATTPITGTRVQLQTGAITAELPGLNLTTMSSLDSGHYRLEGVPEGEFEAWTRKPDTVLDARGQGRLRTEGEVVRRDLLLERHGTVTGRVMPPQAGVTMTLYARGAPRVMTTQGDGGWVFEDVPLGAYTVTASKPSDGDNGQVESTITHDRETATWDVELRGFADVLVDVKSEGVRVTTPYDLVLHNPGPLKTAPGVSAFPYTFHNVPRGAVVATASDTGPAGSAAGTIPASAASLDLTIEVGALARVHGRVSDRFGVPLAAPNRARVRLQSASGAYEIETDDAGHYEFQNVAATGSIVVNAALAAAADRARARYAFATTAPAADVPLDLRLDLWPPTLVASEPARDARDVPIDRAELLLDFSEAMDAASLAGYVLLDGIPLSVATVGNRVTANIAGLLRSSQTHTLLVRGVVEDGNGVELGSDTAIRFTAVDSTPPTARLDSPIAGARSVPVRTPVRVAFSEAIAGSSITTSSASLDCGSGSWVPILEANRVYVAFNGGLLPPDRRCTVTLTTAIQDVSGVALASPESWSFDSEDTTPPVVDSLVVFNPPSAYIEGLTIVVEATSSSVDVVRVDVFVQGVRKATAESAPWRASIVVPTRVEVGDEFIVTAIAVDDAGNPSVDRNLVIPIASDLPPTIAITSPDTQPKSLGETINVMVEANDDVDLREVSMWVEGLSSLPRQVRETSGPGPKTFTFPFTTPLEYSDGFIVIQAAAVDSKTQTAAAAAVRVPLVETGIKGLVLRPRTGQPAADVEVRLKQLFAPGSEFVGSTGASGNAFQVGCVAGGPYRITLHELASGRRLLASGYQVDAGQILDVGSLTLGGAGTLSGNVTVSATAPLTPWRIQVDTPYGRLEQEFTGSTYRFGKLPADLTYVTARSVRTDLAVGVALPGPHDDGFSVVRDFALPPPVVNRLDPSSVAANLPATLTLESYNHTFAPDATVWLVAATTPPGETALAIPYRSSSTIHATFPPHDAAAVSIEVRNPDGGRGVTALSVDAGLLGRVGNVAADDVGVANGTVYVAGRDGVVAFDAAPSARPPVWTSRGTAGEPGRSYGRLAIVGDRLLASTGDRVHLFDIANPESIVFVPAPTADVVLGPITDLVAFAPHQALAFADNRMFLLTIASDEVQLAATAYLGYDAARARVVGDRLYVASGDRAGGTGGLRVFDLARPERPSLLGERLGNYRALAVAGTTVVAATSSTLELLDVTEPHAITLVASRPRSGVTELSIARGLAFVADGSAVATSYSLVDLAEGLRLNAGVAGSKRISFGANLAFAALGESGLYGFEPWAQPPHPHPRVARRGASSAAGGTSFTVAGEDFAVGATVAVGEAYATEVFVGDGFLRALAPAGEHGREDLIVTNPDAKSGTLAQSLEYTDEPQLFSVSPAFDTTTGGANLVADGVNLVDGTPIQVGTETKTMTSGRFSAPPGSHGLRHALTVAGETIAEVFTSTDYILDLDRQGPLRGTVQRLAVRSLADGGVMLATAGDGAGAGVELVQLDAEGRGVKRGRINASYGKVASIGTSFLSVNDQIWSIADISNPTLAFTAAGFNAPAVRGDRLITPVDGCLFDVANPAAPVELGCLYQSLGSVALGERYVYDLSWPSYATDYRRIFRVYDFGSPARPYEVGEAVSFAAASPLALAGDRLFFAASASSSQSPGLYFADLADPSRPTLHGPFLAPSGQSLRAASAPVVIGERVFAVTASGGLHGFRKDGVSSYVALSSPLAVDRGIVAIASDGSRIYAARGVNRLLVYEAGSEPGELRIASFTPNSGPAGGGTVMTVNGRGFASGCTLAVNGVPAPAVIFLDADTLRVVAPPGAGSNGVVKVTNPDGRVATLGGFAYLTVAPPGLTHAMPASSPLRGLRTINLSGWNLAGVTEVRFEQGTSVAVGTNLHASDRSIAVDVPSAPAGVRGLAQIVASNAHGSARLEYGFTYEADTVADAAIGGGEIAACGSYLFFSTFSSPGPRARTYDLDALDWASPALTPAHGPWTLSNPGYGAPFIRECIGERGVGRDRIYNPDGSVELATGVARLVKVRGDRMYTVAEHPSTHRFELRTYDVGALAAPLSPLSTLATAGECTDQSWLPQRLRLLAAGDFVTASCENYADIFDALSSPPQALGLIGSPNPAWSQSNIPLVLEVEPHRAFTVDGSAWDLANPTAPRRITTDTGLRSSLNFQAMERGVAWGPGHERIYLRSGSRAIDVFLRTSLTDFVREERIVTPVAFSGFVLHDDLLILDNGPTVLRLDARPATLEVLSIDPPDGSTAGGQNVILRGRHLGGALSVSFGGIPSPSVQVVSPSELAVVTPASPSSGPVEVVVASATQSDSTSYRYGLPRVRYLAPGSGAFTGSAFAAVLDGELPSGTIEATVSATPCIATKDPSGRRITVAVPRIEALGREPVVFTVGAEPLAAPDYELGPWTFALPPNTQDLGELAFRGDDFALLTAASPALTLVDLRTLSSPAVVVETASWTSARQAALDGDLCFSQATAWRVDASAPTIEIAASFASTSPDGYELVGDHLFAAQGTGFQVLDVIREPTLSVADSIAHDAALYPFALSWRQGRLYLAGWGEEPVVAVRMNTAAPPQVTDSVRWARSDAFASSLLVSGEFVFAVVSDTSTYESSLVVLAAEDLDLVGEVALPSSVLAFFPGSQRLVRHRLGAEEILWIAGAGAVVAVDVSSPANPFLTPTRGLALDGAVSALAARAGVLVTVESERNPWPASDGQGYLRGYPIGNNEVDLYGVYPDHGPADHWISIDGYGFDPSSEVFFDTTQATAVRVLGPNRILVKVPALAARTYDVKVSIPGSVPLRESLEAKSYDVE